MKIWVFLFMSTVGLPLFGQMKPIFMVKQTSTGEWVMVIRHDFHEKYGCSYPLTYKFELSQPQPHRPVVWKRYSCDSSWCGLERVTRDSVFNGIDAVRFDSANCMVYASVGFSWDSDSLFLKVSDEFAGIYQVNFEGICKYYDNRSAVVTISFDDWSDPMATSSVDIINMFRSFGLYMTGGVITGRCSPSTWTQIQMELDSGYVEVASHSRTHQQTPYINAVGEVEGSDSDIVNHLNLPSSFKKGNKQYVYTWISPFSQFDATVDSLVGIAAYIIPRQVPDGYSTFNTWNAKRGHYWQTPATIEIGPTPWVGGDTVLQNLDSLFDSVASKGNIYHLMFHPQVVDPIRNNQYFNGHLKHISGRTDIWYVCFGHLYLYHLMEQASNNLISDVSPDYSRVVSEFELLPNYPNPFNPKTSIRYQLSTPCHVTLKVYDALGRELVALVNEQQQNGCHEVTFDGSKFASGTYFYRIVVGGWTKTGTMVLLK